MSNNSKSGANTRVSGRVGLGKTVGENSGKESKKSGPELLFGSGEGKGEEGNDKCGDCKKIVTDGENGVECEICANWFHASCQGLSKEVYAALVHSCVHWYCASCNVRVIGIIKKVAKLEEGQAKIEEAMLNTRNELGEVQTELKTMGLALETLTDKVGKIGTQQPTSVNVCRNDIVEEVEIQRRRLNVVFSGIKEEDNCKDKIRDICEALGGAPLVNAIEADKIERIGRRNGKPRLVRAVLKNTEAKAKLLQAGPLLSKRPEFARVYISPDMTRRQQETDKILRDKLKDLRSQGATDVKISKGRIVKKGDGLDLVVYTPPPSLTR